MMQNTSLNSSTSVKRKSVAVPSECRVCGVPATYSYFGTVSCQPCKMFFKRNAERETLKCDSDGHCEINLNTRHVCSSCRLSKCFKSGMEIEMLRSPFPKKKKTSEKRIIVMNQLKSTALVRSNQIDQFPTLNLLQSDQSTLTLDQWNLISNLSHCYDEYSGLLIGENYMREQNVLPLKLRFKHTSMIKLVQMTLDGSRSLYENNRDFLSLSTDDRSTLLHRTFAHTGSLSYNIIMYHIQLIHKPAYYYAVEMMTHKSLIPTAMRIANRLDFDMIIMKLIIAILSFSTTTYTVYANIPPVNLSNMKQILQIQNKYIELMWRYLLYKYNFKQTVKCFSDLIRCLFAVNEAVVKTHDVEWLTDAIDSLVEQSEQNLTLMD